jgi:hypothetical protein
MAAALADARSKLGLDATAEIHPCDGRFVAPEHPANRAALRAEPNLPSLLLPVEPRAFFQPLPGWPAARVLARWDGTDLDRLRSIEPVERYYRLGAGASGALSRLHTGLFETEPASIDAAVLLERLRHSGHANTLNLLFLYLERKLAERRVLDEKLAQLPRAAYPFGRLRADFTSAGVSKAVLESRGALGRAYAEVTRDILSATRGAGQELVDSGVSEEAALERLAEDPQRWTTLGAQRARTLATRLQST